MSIYTTVAVRTEARTGSVSVDSSIPTMLFSAPAEFKGRDGVWTPEHFFTAAISACFVTTFDAIAEISKFAFEALTVSAEGRLEKVEGGYRFTEVCVRPHLTIAGESNRERALRLLEKAEHACLISRSVSARITMQPEIVIAVTA